MGMHERPLASLLTQVVSDIAYLLQTEIRLARAEISQKVSQAANGGVFIGVAAVLALPALFILMLAAVRWLDVAGLPDRWGYVVVGGVSLAVAMALALKGAGNFKGTALVPDRTIEQIKADYSVAKERVS